MSYATPFPAITLLLVALALGGCGGGSNTAPASPVASISVSPSVPELSVGQSVQLTAVLLDGSGRTITGRPVTWSSLDASIISVTASGLITAHQPGTTRIAATAEGKSGFANPVVNAPAPVPVARIEVSPGFDTVEEGATRQLTATVYDADENVLTGRGIVWTSLEAEIAHVDGGGLVTALRPGITTITARVEGKSTTAEIRVEAYYPFELLYSRHAEGLAPELYTLDFKDPAAVALPVFPGGQPAVSPHGARIAFVVSTSPGTAIHTAKRDGSDVKVLISDGNFNELPSWSPDGNFIAFRRQVSGENSNIWVMRAADGADAVNLTAVHGEDASQYSPAWSPVLSDGTSRIAYAQFQGGQQLIWTMRSDGTDHRQTTFSATADDDQPAWSPDGQKIVFQRSDAAIFGDLWVVDANGGAGASLRPAAPLAGPQHWPQWSPDGKLIAFMSRHEGGFYQVYTVWSDGSRLARRTSEPADHGFPRWLKQE
jgi:dipeptidyl aminopeptidase/acylaminoacyl peptidase